MFIVVCPMSKLLVNFNQGFLKVEVLQFIPEGFEGSIVTRVIHPASIDTCIPTHIVDIAEEEVRADSGNNRYSDLLMDWSSYKEKYSDLLITQRDATYVAEMREPPKEEIEPIIAEPDEPEEK